jgi:hypothetical protein
MSMIGGSIWVMIFAVLAFSRPKMVRNQVRIDCRSVLESARYRGVLQESIFNS